MDDPGTRGAPLAAAPDRATRGSLLAFASISTAALFNFMAIGSVLPVLPLYVKGPVGAGDVAVGVVIGAFAFTAAIARPLGGRLADSALRKLVLMVGLAICSAGGAMLFLPLDVPGLVLARLVVGFGDGWVFTAGVAWIVDLTPEERRGQAIGVFGIAVWGGISLGTVFGQLIFSGAGYDWVWAFAAIAPLVGLAVSVWTPAGRPVRQSPLEEVATAEMGAPMPSPDEAPAATRPAREGSWLPAGAIRPGIALGLANVGFGTIAGFIVLLLDSRGIGHGAAAFTLYTAGVVLTRLFFGWIPDRWGARRSALAGGIFQTAGIVAIGSATTLPAALIGAGLTGIGSSLIFPSLALIVVNATDPAARATAMGWFTSFFDVGVALGAPFAGLVASVGGGENYPAAFYAAAAVCLAGALIGFFGTRGSARRASVA